MNEETGPRTWPESTGSPSLAAKSGGPTCNTHYINEFNIKLVSFSIKLIQLILSIDPFSSAADVIHIFISIALY